MKFIITALTLTMLVSGCDSSTSTTADPVDSPVTNPIEDPVTNLFEPLESDLTLNTALYQQDGYGTLNVIRVDIRTSTDAGVCTIDEQSGCTLADVLLDVVSNDDFTVDIPVHFSSVDFPNDGSVSNAELRLRGGGSRIAPQKSFRIKLDSKQALWRNERYLQLNKHPFESTRIRNKLAFDVMSEVPHLPSMRTQFVNLWIDDGAGPVDQGLYTHVERPNGSYLERHGLDANGNLYKAEDFRFDETDLLDIAVDQTGEPVDEDRFESSLEIEEGSDHRTLVAMMSALHDPTRTFESVLDQYFNRNNVMTWMAVNILLQQADATRHNFLLYSPSESDKFYFIPWDYDAAMGVWLEPPNSYENDALRQRLEYGYALGSANVFTRNFYKLPGMHEKMLSAVNQIHENYITDTSITDKATLYSNLVETYQERAPDSNYNESFTLSSGIKLSKSPAENVQALMSRFSVPLPPTLLSPTLANGQWTFSWTPGYDVTGNTLTYDLEVSNSLTFAPDDMAVSITGIEDAANIVEQLIDADQLPVGTYFARLSARASNEPNRFWQVASNRLVLEAEGERNYGVISFIVQ